MQTLDSLQGKCSGRQGPELNALRACTRLRRHRRTSVSFFFVTVPLCSHTCGMQSRGNATGSKGWGPWRLHADTLLCARARKGLARLLGGLLPSPPLPA
jgi:hypothetical protein